MGNEINNKSQSKDNKQIAIIVAIGIIVIACICCLLIVAGYFLYNDLTKTAIASPQPTPEVVLVPTNSNNHFSNLCTGDDCNSYYISKR